MRYQVTIHGDEREAEWAAEQAGISREDIKSAELKYIGYEIILTVEYQPGSKVYTIVGIDL